MHDHTSQRPVQKVDPVTPKDEKPADMNKDKKLKASGQVGDDKGGSIGSKKKEEELVS